ncbi:SufS family cysteine desulfurase [Candidatus Omnitrophota bacterium]
MTTPDYGNRDVPSPGNDGISPNNPVPDDLFNPQFINTMAQELYAELSGIMSSGVQEAPTQETAVPPETTSGEITPGSEAPGRSENVVTPYSSDMITIADPALMEIFPGMVRSGVPDISPAEKKTGGETDQVDGEIPLLSAESEAPLFPIEEAMQPATGLQYDLHHPTYYFLTEPVQPIRKTTVKAFDIRAIRRDFPILCRKIRGKTLIWLDNAATSQKPRQVIDELARYYREYNSNIHRGAHTLAEYSTDAYEGAREKARLFLGAKSTREIVFTRGTTEAINLVAQSYGRENIKEGDEIVLTTLEHHSNIVPWQLLSKEKGAVLRVVPINDQGEIELDEYEKLLGPRTKIVTMTHVSNALGTVLPVKYMIELAHRQGAKVLVDGAQSVPHFRINLQVLNADFYALSGHKLFGPTGIGVLYGKEKLLENMPPWQGGGSMIDDVTFDKTTYNELPHKFEAGTPNIAGAVGLGAALDYINRIGFDSAAQYEREVFWYAVNKLSEIPGLRLIGTASNRISVLSFILDGIQTANVGKELDKEGIAVRSGHHCAQPTMRRFGLEGTVRPSLAFYNTTEEIDRLVEAIFKIKSSLI